MSPTEIKRTVTLTISIAVSFGLLVFVAVVVVLGLELNAAIKNTSSLARDVGKLAIEEIEERIQDHFEHVAQQVDHVAASIREGLVNPNKEEQLGLYLHAAMAGIPQVHALAFVGAAGHITLVSRERVQLQDPKKSVWSKEASDRMESRGKAVVIRDGQMGDPIFDTLAPNPLSRHSKWGDVTWSSLAKDAMVARSSPVRRGDDYLGTVVAWVGTAELSEFVHQIEKKGNIEAFILYGRDHVLAHEAMVAHRQDLTMTHPLPALRTYASPQLSAIWSEANRIPDRLGLEPPLSSHSVDLDGVHYAYIFKAVDYLGGKPWVIGGYMRLDEIDRAFSRLYWAGLLGLLILLGAVLVAVQLGRTIAGPVRKLARATTQISQLELDDITPLQGSRIRELNQLALAYNKMINGLRWFNTYVPKTLVQQLLKNDRSSIVRSHTRDVTVMFTDIVGFSGGSEGRAAEEIAEFLNEHFSLILKCIEMENGTLDKFIGDSAMVFWGAPNTMNDHAQRACRSAMKIASEIAKDNQARIEAGRQPVWVRIGIHSGPATVGNIGAPGRVNYTIVGDVVNIANRVEQLARDYRQGGQAVTILITADTKSNLSEDYRTIARGTHEIRGRASKIELFQLLTADDFEVHLPADQ